MGTRLFVILLCTYVIFFYPLTVVGVIRDEKMFNVESAQIFAYRVYCVDTYFSWKEYTITQQPSCIYIYKGHFYAHMYSYIVQYTSK